MLVLARFLARYLSLAALALSCNLFLSSSVRRIDFLSSTSFSSSSTSSSPMELLFLFRSQLLSLYTSTSCNRGSRSCIHEYRIGQTVLMYVLAVSTSSWYTTQSSDGSLPNNHRNADATDSRTGASRQHCYDFLSQPAHCTVHQQLSNVLIAVDEFCSSFLVSVSDSEKCHFAMVCLAMLHASSWATVL